MPLPTPHDKEKRGDFLKRCMLDLGKKGEFPDAKQRAAVCHSQFDKGRSKASVTIGENDDETLFFQNEDSS